MGGPPCHGVVGIGRGGFGFPGPVPASRASGATPAVAVAPGLLLLALRGRCGLRCSNHAAAAQPQRRRHAHQRESARRRPRPRQLVTAVTAVQMIMGNYTLGTRLVWSGITSTSKSLARAVMFAKGGGIVFRVRSVILSLSLVRYRPLRLASSLPPSVCVCMCMYLYVSVCILCVSARVYCIH